MPELKAGDRVQVTTPGFEQVRGTVVAVACEPQRLTTVSVDLDLPFRPLGRRWPFLAGDLARLTPEQEDAHHAAL